MRRAVSTILILVLLSVPVLADNAANAALYARIREEGMERSQILNMMHVLTDIYGPRLTGSPNHKKAAEWTIEQMQKWGLRNGRAIANEPAKTGINSAYSVGMSWAFRTHGENDSDQFDMLVLADYSGDLELLYSSAVKRLSSDGCI